MGPAPQFLTFRLLSGFFNRDPSLSFFTGSEYLRSPTPARRSVEFVSQMKSLTMDATLDTVAPTDVSHPFFARRAVAIIDKKDRVSGF
jgi:hypothetical protein